MKMVQLASVCRVFTDGDWIESKDQSPDGIRLVQTGNVGVGIFKGRNEKARYISLDTFERLRCTEIFEGDCLISRLPDPVGRACIIPDTGERMITAVDCTILRFDPGKLISDFFAYFSQSSQYLDEVRSLSTGATRTRISRSNLGKVEIPCPSLPEQQRIVAILDEVFEGIDTAAANAEKNLTNARELYENAMEAIFSCKGIGWQQKLLGDIATFRNGINFTKSSTGEAVKIVGVKDFQQNFFAPLDSLETVIPDGTLPEHDYLQTGDVLFVRSNGNKELIGRSLLIGGVQEKITFSGFTIRGRLNDTNFLLPEYLCHFLKSSKARRAMIEGGNGVNIKSLNQTTLSSLLIAFPVLQAEQQTVVDNLNELGNETQRLEAIYQQKLAALDELKKSILHQAFSGQLH